MFFYTLIGIHELAYTRINDEILIPYFAFFCPSSLYFKIYLLNLYNSINHKINNKNEKNRFTNSINDHSRYLSN